MNPLPREAVRTAIEIAISLSLVALLLIWCFRIVQPFISIIVWGTVIAVSLSIPAAKLQTMLGGDRRRTLWIFSLLMLALLLVPSFLFTETMISGLKGFRGALQTGEFSLPSPDESVRGWPVIGERLYGSWESAAADTEAWLTTNAAQIRGVMGTLLGKLANVGVSILQFALSIIVATLMLAHEDSGKAATRRFFTRLMGAEQAEGLLTLLIATVRSVTVGVLGIAVIQSLGAGVGMVAVGVPAAGLLALVVLMLAVAQLPPWLLLLPVSVYVFSEHSTPVAMVFLVWSLVVSFADMFLKPMLLGRGVEAPMPVILIGAIGGMLMSGIIGLFTGAVLLALGYKLFQAWLNAEQPTPETTASN